MDYIKKIEDSLNFIEDNLDENITLDVLARNAYCSRFHFHRIFKATVGQSVMEYIRQKKLVRSVNELLYSEGYGSKNNFYMQVCKIHSFRFCKARL